MLQETASPLSSKEQKSMARPLRKRRTREHILADRSVHHVEGHVLHCGWVIERLIHDYGIDLMLVTFNRQGEVEEGPILLQLKATQRLRLRLNATIFPFRIERADLILWLAERFPVILIVYDAARNVAYWVYVQSYFRRQQGFNVFTAGQSITIHFPLVNVVTPTAIRRFARFRDHVLTQMREVIHDEDAIDPIR
jgi:hypothetical protein